MISLFHQGFKGLAESKFAGVVGSAFRVVGIDYRSVPGLIRVHQKLTKNSGSTVTELCKTAVPVSDGSTLWFSSESGKIWREVAGVWTLVYTLVYRTIDLLLSSFKDTLAYGTDFAFSAKLRFSTDGLLAHINAYPSGSLTQILLQRPFDISSYTKEGSFLPSTISLSSQTSHFFTSDGLKLFLLNATTVRQYALDTAYKLHTAELIAEYDLSAQTTTAQSIWFSSDGLKMFILDDGGEVFEYDLTLSFDLRYSFSDTVDALIVGQGGGGAGVEVSASDEMGGGGGAGQVLHQTAITVNTFSNSVVVGSSGGAGGVAQQNGTDGASSSFYGYQALGGGGGGTTSTNGRSGASGGGGGDDASGGTATAGNAGGNGSSDGGGGGGGAGATGSNGSGSNGGSGGAGVSNSITGASVFYGGGGGGGAGSSGSGGAGGAGGGGAGGTNDNGNAATPNTGGGGGGAGRFGTTTANGGAGGTGIVIVRYLTAAFTGTGGTITTDGLYTIHIFTSSGTLSLNPKGPTFSTSKQLPLPEAGKTPDFTISADGKVILLALQEDAKDEGGSLLQYYMSTAWDVSSATYDNRRTELLFTPTSINTAGGYLHIGKNATRNIYRYDLHLSEEKILSASEHTHLQAATSQGGVVLDLMSNTTNVSLRLTEESGPTNDVERVAQSVFFTENRRVDTIVLRASGEETPTCTLRCSIREGTVDGTLVAQATTEVKALSGGENFLFNFNSELLRRRTTYWVIFEVTDYADLASNQWVQLSTRNNSYTDGSVQVYRSGAWTTTIDSGGPTTDIDLNFAIYADLVETEEEDVNAVYFTTEKMLYRIPLENIASWADNLKALGAFTNGHTEHHPMAVQNLSLFIGDAHSLAEVDDVGTFVQETPLNLPKTETVSALTSYDIDLLIGSQATGMGYVRRWDTVSESWSAQDEVFDEGGVTAFLRDDNYIYVATGPFARLYFYNGEKMEPYTQVPGDWSPSKEAIIYPNATAFFINMPVFGLSNLTGNPQLQGVYGLGSYGRGFDKTLSLDFPISAGTFEGVSIGALLVKGADMYVAWKTASSAGIDKLDYTAKYASAYIETRILSDIITPQGISDGRHIQKTLEAVDAPYAELPTSTGVVFSYKKKNETNYTQLDTAKHINSDERQAIEVAQSVPKVAALQLKATFTVSGNNAPAIEDIRYNLISAE